VVSMSEHDVEVDHEALDAELDAAGTGAGTAETGHGEPGTDLVVSPVESWMGVARIVAGQLAALAPNWQIPADQVEENARAIARVLAAWGPSGPGNPEDWNPWLQLAYCAAVTVGMYGLEFDQETGVVLKPLQREPIDGEPKPGDRTGERVDQLNPRQGSPAGFSTVSDDSDQH